MHYIFHIQYQRNISTEFALLCWFLT